MRMFITGTDTGVGKTVAAAWAMLHLDGAYWKPVQSGLDGETDLEAVRRMTGLPQERFHPSAYALPDPLSPHEAARRAGVSIALSEITAPETARPLVIEGAGGLLVPLNDREMMIDLITHLGAVAVLVCRTTLGTINHTLLSLEALRRRNLPIAGLILVGPEMAHNREALAQFGRVPIIAHIPPLPDLTRAALAAIPPRCDLESAFARVP